MEAPAERYQVYASGCLTTISGGRVCTDHSSIRPCAVEFPEPYHSLPFQESRRMMKALPQSYATVAVRLWLKDRHKIRLRCELLRQNAAQLPTDLTADEIAALQWDKRESAELLRRYLGGCDARDRNGSQEEGATPPVP